MQAPAAAPGRTGPRRRAVRAGRSRGSLRSPRPSPSRSSAPPRAVCSACRCRALSPGHPGRLPRRPRSPAQPPGWCFTTPRPRRARLWSPARARPAAAGPWQERGRRSGTAGRGTGGRRSPEAWRVAGGRRAAFGHGPRPPASPPASGGRARSSRAPRAAGQPASAPGVRPVLTTSPVPAGAHLGAIHFLPGNSRACYRNHRGPPPGTRARPPGADRSAPAVCAESQGGGRGGPRHMVALKRRGGSGEGFLRRSPGVWEKLIDFNDRFPATAAAAGGRGAAGMRGAGADVTLRWAGAPEGAGEVGKAPCPRTPVQVRCRQRRSAAPPSSALPGLQSQGPERGKRVTSLRAVIRAGQTLPRVPSAAGPGSPGRPGKPTGAASRPAALSAVPSPTALRHPLQGHSQTRGHDPAAQPCPFPGAPHPPFTLACSSRSPALKRHLPHLKGNSCT